MVLLSLFACKGGSVTLDDSGAEGPGPDCEPAAETCNGVDDDCDGEVDNGASDAIAWFADADGDGYGDPENAGRSCEVPTATVDNDQDCDDGDATVNPEGIEVCDGANTDEDCDGSADDADSGATGQLTFYDDTDGDGHGDAATAVEACDPVGDQTDVGDDCDDEDAKVWDECAGAYNGTWTATIAIDVVAIDVGQKDSCTGTGNLTIDDAKSPAIRGSLTCKFSLLGSQTVKIDGLLDAAPSVSGNLWVSTLKSPWTGSITKKMLEGSFSGTGSYGGYNLEFSGTLEAYR